MGFIKVRRAACNVSPANLVQPGNESGAYGVAVQIIEAFVPVVRADFHRQIGKPHGLHPDMKRHGRLAEIRRRIVFAPMQIDGERFWDSGK
jgi:hypothetical protein